MRNIIFLILFVVAAPLFAAKVTTFPGSDGLVPPKKTTTQRDSISNPVQGMIVDNTTTNRPNRYNGTSWSELGSSAGGINYISPDHDAESGTSGWSTYADAAGVAPVDCTGGSPNVTWTQSASSPLRDSYNYLFTKGAANRQGEGVAAAFSVASADKAKPMTISLEYEVGSGTWQAGSDSQVSDLVVYVYDVTNSTLIQPVGYKLTGGSGNPHKYVGQFQTASNSTSYRLCLHEAATGTSAFTLKVDSVSVGPTGLANGPPVSDWTSYTPTGGWTNTTYTGRWRRVGDSMEVYADLSLTGAPVGNATVALPSGYSVDTAKLQSSTVAAIGSMYLLDSGTANYVGSVVYESGQGIVGYAYNVANRVNATIPVTFASGDRVSYHFTVPIAGWGSNVSMSQDADTRVVAAFGTAASGSHTNTGNWQAWPSVTATKDSHAAWSGTTYTAPVSGWYDISATLGYAANSTGQRGIRTTAGGTTYTLAFDDATASGNWIATGSQKAYLTAGQTIAFEAYQSSGGSLSYSGTTFSIGRMSGPATIAASETVAARYKSAAGQAISSGATTIVDFGTADDDSHGSVTTGASWKFTAPVAGRYSVSGLITWAAAAWGVDDNVDVLLYKNGSQITTLNQYGPPSTSSRQVTQSFSTYVKLVAGDYLDIRITHNNGSSRSLAADANSVHVSIAKLGGTP